MDPATHYDAIVIGAGMSGLGAGIRLAHFGKKVCIVEKHSLWGGLNSFYKKAGRPFDVGLHAMTNYAPRGKRGPLSSICRQLRLDPDSLRLREQRESEVRFPSASLRFSNDLGLLESQIATAFPGEIDGFRALVSDVRAYDDGTLQPARVSAREVIARSIRSPLLADMILCPLMFYGSATEHDMDWHQFVIMFKAIFFEGFCRPEGGVRRVLDILRREYLSRGGELRLKTGVRRIVSDDRGARVELETGEVFSAAHVFSSAGRVETARLLGRPIEREAVGRMSFVETIFCLDRPAPALGWEKSIVFFSHRDVFSYRRCPELVDTGAGIICCPENFEGQAPFSEGLLRVTSIANYDRWKALSEDEYQKAKEEFIAAQLDSLSGLGPDFRSHITYRDAFTPLTIEKFTSHDAGAVYGAVEKRLSGESGAANVHLCGTDQGYLGIVGALLSGVIMVNRYGLMEPG